MSYLNLILDLVALMLWLNWRGLGFRQVVPYRSSLAHTLKTTTPGRPRRWPSLAGLAAVLLLRAPLYAHLGPALHWVPQLDLHLITLPFRSDLPGHMLAFSFLSFLLRLGLGYLWLLLPSLVNRGVPDTQPMQHLARLHLGRVDRWPVAARCLLPLVIATVLWMAVHPWLVALGLVPGGRPLQFLAEQGFVLGLTAYLSWKPLLLGLLFLHVLHSYVYLGHSPFLEFVNLTAKSVLRPLGFLPLRLGMVDFAPAVGIVLVWFAAELDRRMLFELFRRLPL
ncbi:MAG TPA: hypothetical protein VNH84_11350 [Candidatus Saccharimonadales bacterium]|nr:hypothetical protein [Candidatus Saccharimonadales bacterium]